MLQEVIDRVNIWKYLQAIFVKDLLYGDTAMVKLTIKSRQGHEEIIFCYSYFPNGMGEIPDGASNH